MSNDGLSDWQHAVEFELETDSNSVQQAAEVVAQTILNLHIKSTVANRIQKTFIETLHSILQKEDVITRNTPLIIRVLVSSDTPRDGSDPISANRNWGFFLVEKQRRCSGLLYHLLELYLYQEID